MQSAFGIEHGEVSKAMSGMSTAAIVGGSVAAGVGVGAYNKKKTGRFTGNGGLVGVGARKAGLGYEKDVSKGMPSAVRAGGGGIAGSFKRSMNLAGKNEAKYKSVSRGMFKEQGKSLKEGRENYFLGRRVDQHAGWRGGSNSGARGTRAALLNDDARTRRAGYKLGKTSGLDRHYRGRVGPMEPLP